jgi:hypothetical protein
MFLVISAAPPVWPVGNVEDGASLPAAGTHQPRVARAPTGCGSGAFDPLGYDRRPLWLKLPKVLSNGITPGMKVHDYRSPGHGMLVSEV